MKGWRTIIFNLLVAIFGALEAFRWIDIVPAEWVPIVIAAVGLINVWLRKVTNTPVGKKATP